MWPVEIEAKIKVDSLAPTRAKLESAGAKFVGDFTETNAIFDTEDRSLLAEDKGLRVRTARNAKTGGEVCTVTYKGPRQHGQLKARDEVELSVANSPDAVELLERIGFVRMLSFETRRESWKLGGCKVELDELPWSLGCFVSPRLAVSAGQRDGDP